MSMSLLMHLLRLLSTLSSQGYIKFPKGFVLVDSFLCSMQWGQHVSFVSEQGSWKKFFVKTKNPTPLRSKKRGENGVVQSISLLPLVYHQFLLWVSIFTACCEASGTYGLPICFYKYKNNLKSFCFLEKRVYFFILSAKQRKFKENVNERARSRSTIPK